MKKKGIIVLVVLVLMQLIRPEINTEKDGTNHISNVFDMPLPIKEILKNSCYDCHSNSTKPVWYDTVAPFSWMISNHVTSGKEHVNFSEWLQYNEYQKKFIINKLIQSVEQHTMPTKGYLTMHKEAALSKEQQQLLVQWFKSLKKIKNENS